MNVLFILVPVSLILSGVALAAFLWTLRASQYDDLAGDAWRILSDEDSPAPTPPARSDPEMTRTCWTAC